MSGFDAVMYSTIIKITKLEQILLIAHSGIAMIFIGGRQNKLLLLLFYLNY